jgi:two-component system, cell cycle sensor histidine kinase and response regulator CckA
MKRKKKAATIPDYTDGEIKSMLASIVDGSDDAILSKSLEGKITSWNKGAERLYGYTADEIIGNHISILCPPEEKDAHDRIIKRIKRGEKVEHFETERIGKGGSRIGVSLTVSPIRDSRGAISGASIISREITGRKRAEEALRASEEKYRSLVDGANEAILVAQDGMLKFVNRKAAELSGFLETELLKKPFSEFIHPDDRKLVVDNYGSRLKGESVPSRYEFRLLTVDNSAKWVEINTVLMDWNGKPATLNFLTDVTEHRKAEEKQKESEERYHTLFDDAKDGIALADAATGKIVECNHALCGMVERDKTELVGQQQSLLHGPEQLIGGLTQSFVEHMASGPDMVSQDEFMSKSGKKIPVEIKASRIHLNGRDYLLGIFRDISERKRLENEKERLLAQLLQAQKMEAIGTLAGGVAHDFNNLLTAISGFTTLAMGKTDESSPIHRDLKQVSIAATKAADVIRQLLLFSRKQHMEPVPMDPNTTIRRLLKMIDRIIGEDIVIETDLQKEIWRILGDEGNVEQVLMNLAVNAKDAMPKGGKLFIKTENVTIDQEYCRTLKTARPGRFVCLSISDTGTGMDELTQEHIFEPFFTTKEAGKGTGLGLSVVFGIVQLHKGWINVVSEPGLGTTFKVFFPSTSDMPGQKSKEDAPLASLHGKGERIMVVEDHAEVRAIAMEMLAINGYSVFPVSSAKEAMELFEKENSGFDLVFCDVVLTDSAGTQLVEDLLKRWKFGVVITSGYTDEKADWDLIKERKYRFLHKPYTMQELLQAVKEVLEEKAS